MNKKLLDRFELKNDPDYYGNYWTLKINQNSWIDLIKNEKGSWQSRYYTPDCYRELLAGRVSLETAKIKALEFAKKIATEDLEKSKNRVSELESFLEKFYEVPTECSWCGDIIPESLSCVFAYGDVDFCSLDCQRSYQEEERKNEKN